MLTIRLARWGKHKSPFYRIVLTEHTKPAQSGYMKVLGWFDPINHKMEANVEEIKKYISNWAKPSERVAKLLLGHTKDELFKKFFTETTKTKKPTKEEDKK